MLLSTLCFYPLPKTVLLGLSVLRALFRRVRPVDFCVLKEGPGVVRFFLGDEWFFFSVSSFPPRQRSGGSGASLVRAA